MLLNNLTWYYKLTFKAEANIFIKLVAKKKSRFIAFNV